MKKTSLILAAVLCLMGVMGQAQAATTGTISVTVSLASEIAVTVTPSTWTVGAVSVGGLPSAPSPLFTATVGNVATKLDIKGANGAGAWAIGAPAAADRFVVAVSAPAITLTTANQVLAANVPMYGSKTFTLTYQAPTIDTKGGGVDQSFPIVITASAP